MESGASKKSRIDDSESPIFDDDQENTSQITVGSNEINDSQPSKLKQ